MSRLFTLIVEYRSLAHVLQHHANSIDELVCGLHRSTSWFGAGHKIQLLPEDSATPLQGLTGVWCIAPDIDGKTSLVNIVETSDVESRCNTATVVLLFDGGTYVDQVYSLSAKSTIDCIDRVLGWDKLPSVVRRRVADVCVKKELVSVERVRCRIDDKPAEIIVVTSLFS